MNRIKYLSVVLVMASSVFYYSCDDSGLTPHEGPAGIIAFTQTIKLPTLNPTNDGYYCLWILLNDTTGVPRILNLGVFNVLANGSPVDINGEPITFTMNLADTIDLARAVYSVITIQKDQFVSPTNTVILGGPFTVTIDSVSAQLRFNDPLALGTAGDTLIARRHRGYMINTPSNNGVNCEKGIWFITPSGEPTLPNVQLNPGGGWQFRGWLHNKITNEYFSTGAFFDPRAADFDGAGPCSGSEQGYNAPGQDWVQPGCANIINIYDGNHDVFIVLEPKGRTDALPPFNLKLFLQSIFPTLGCNRFDNLYSQSELLPRARVKITR
jgi:hypothetical protein